jgi:indole-3-glycerol phosphate synthase
MHGVLKDIIDHKRTELAARKAQTPFEELEALVAQAEPPRNFFAAVTQHPDAFHSSVIAEIKRKSPSAGWIRPEYQTLATSGQGGGGGGGGGFDPAHIARRYHANGAAAISCLTDEKFFAGDLRFIERIKEAVPLPVLRKDFIIDQWQLWESRAAGADAVLLIGECLTTAEMMDMFILAQRLGLTVLLEVHEVETLLRVRPHVGFPHPSYFLLGINNRDLAAQKVDVNHTLRLLDMVDDPTALVSESGIRTNKDVTWLRHNRVRIVLVGEELMRAEDPGAALAKLLGTDVR